MTVMAELGLRERKKAATRQALSEAALRLATEQGAERLTVEAIADEVGVRGKTRRDRDTVTGEVRAICKDTWVKWTPDLQPDRRHPR